MQTKYGLITVRALIKEVSERRYAVPDIQRPFVWDMKRVKKLVDSIIENVPIGGIVIWAANASSSATIRETSSVLPSYDPKNKLKLFVIDGQQRLSVLYRLFEGGEYRVGPSRVINFGSLALDPTAKMVVSVKKQAVGHIVSIRASTYSTREYRSVGSH